MLDQDMPSSRIVKSEDDCIDVDVCKYNRASPLGARTSSNSGIPSHAGRNNLLQSHLQFVRIRLCGGEGSIRHHSLGIARIKSPSS